MMVLMATYDEDVPELGKLKIITQELAARLSEDRWKIKQISRLEQFRTYMAELPLLDILLYDVSDTRALEHDRRYAYLF